MGFPPVNVGHPFLNSHPDLRAFKCPNRTYASAARVSDSDQNRLIGKENYGIRVSNSVPTAHRGFREGIKNKTCSAFQVSNCSGVYRSLAVSDTRTRNRRYYAVQSDIAIEVRLQSKSTRPNVFVQTKPYRCSSPSVPYAEIASPHEQIDSR